MSCDQKVLTVFGVRGGGGELVDVPFLATAHRRVVGCAKCGPHATWRARNTAGCCQHGGPSEVFYLLNGVEASQYHWGKYYILLISITFSNCDAWRVMPHNNAPFTPQRFKQHVL